MHYTVTNWLFDKVMPDTSSGSTFKVVSAVARETAGWQRQWTENTLSFSDFERLTGMARDSVASGLREALERGYITRKESGRSFHYSLTIAVPTKPESPKHNSPKIQPTKPEKSENPTVDESENPTDSSPKIQPIAGDTLYNINKDNSEPPQPPPIIPETELPEPFKPKYLRFIPVPLQDNKFIDAWTDWEEYQSTQGKFSGMSAKKQLSDLGGWGLERAIAAINHSIKQGYKGIYEPTKSSGANGVNAVDYRPLWNQVVAEIKKNGRRSTHQWNGQIAPVLKKAGGYTRLCSLSTFEAEQTFKSAFQDTQ